MDESIDRESRKKLMQWLRKHALLEQEICFFKELHVDIYLSTLLLVFIDK